MPWTTTRVDSYYIGNPARGHERLVTVNDCTYSGTGYGGGYGDVGGTTGSTGATGPSLSDLGHATSDSTVQVTVYEKETPAPIVKRTAIYDIDNEKLIVGVTAGTDLTGFTWRVVTTCRTSP